MRNIGELKEHYESLDWSGLVETESSIKADCLLTFQYEYPGANAIVGIETDEFSAVCPWTGLPDFGSLQVNYTPDQLCLELKSVKYYLLGYRNVGIVREHAANRICNDLVAACKPIKLDLILDYKTRGGLHTVLTVKYERP